MDHNYASAGELAQVERRVDVHRDELNMIERRLTELEKDTAKLRGLERRVDIHREELNNHVQRIVDVERFSVSADTVADMDRKLDALDKSVSILNAAQETSNTLVGRLIVGIISATVLIVGAAILVIMNSPGGAS